MSGHVVDLKVKVEDVYTLSSTSFRGFFKHTHCGPKKPFFEIVKICNFTLKKPELRTPTFSLTHQKMKDSKCQLRNHQYFDDLAQQNAGLSFV